MTDLEKRMAIHTPGQVTWPKLGAHQKCTACEHFSTHDVAPVRQKNGYGRCALAREMLGRDGAQFVGATAQICPQFRSKT